MVLQISPYKLEFQTGGQFQEGCLIKVCDGSFFGAADLCPKPQFGDLDWRQELESKGSLFKRAYELALEDLSARKEKKSLQSDLPVRNNILITDLEKFDFSKEDLSAQKTYKIKYSGEPADFAKKLNAIFSGKSIKLRLDFNAKLKPLQFDSFLKQADASLLKSIDYIEDPTEFCEAWFEWNREVPIAADFQKPKNSFLLEKAKQELVFIFKPSRERPESDVNRFTITSAMDHPVGVAHALRIAQKMFQNDSGLLTLDLFKPTAFSGCFDRKEEWINFSKSNAAESGVGMTRELERLNWIYFDGKVTC